MHSLPHLLTHHKYMFHITFFFMIFLYDINMKEGFCKSSIVLDMVVMNLFHAAWPMHSLHAQETNGASTPLSLSWVSKRAPVFLPLVQIHFYPFEILSSGRETGGK